MGIVEPRKHSHMFSQSSSLEFQSIATSAFPLLEFVILTALTCLFRVRLDHAYSLDADEVIEGYSREPTPLCYVWPKDKPPTPPSQVSDTQSTLIPPLTDIIDKLLKPSTSQPESSSSHSNEDNALIDSEELCQGAGRRAFDSSMKKLKEYHNGETGAKSDHLYTTRKPDNAYKQQVVATWRFKYINLGSSRQGHYGRQENKLQVLGSVGSNEI